jgi:hypothetical protein
LAQVAQVAVVVLALLQHKMELALVFRHLTLLVVVEILVMVGQAVGPTTLVLLELEHQAKVMLAAQD